MKLPKITLDPDAYRFVMQGISGMCIATGLFEMMCVHARFVICGAARLPPGETLPMLNAIILIAMGFAVWGVDKPC